MEGRFFLPRPFNKGVALSSVEHWGCFSCSALSHSEAQDQVSLSLTRPSGFWREWYCFHGSVGLQISLLLGFKLVVLFFFSLIRGNLHYLLISAVHLKVYLLLFIEHLDDVWQKTLHIIMTCKLSISKSFFLTFSPWLECSGFRHEVQYHEYF